MAGSLISGRRIEGFIGKRRQSAKERTFIRVFKIQAQSGADKVWESYGTRNLELGSVRWM